MESVWAAIVGAVVGGGIVLFAEWLQFRRGVGERRRTAAMQIATQIRIWLTATSRSFDEHSIYYEPDDEDDDPNANVFPRPSDIPGFPFQDSLESISLLKTDDAKQLFDLIERRSSAENEASDTAFLQDFQDASEIFEVRIAELYLECVSFYAKLAKQVGWSGAPVGESEIESMHQKAAKLSEIRNRQSAGDLTGLLEALEDTPQKQGTE